MDIQQLEKAVEQAEARADKEFEKNGKSPKFYRLSDKAFELQEQLGEATE